MAKKENIHFYLTPGHYDKNGRILQKSTMFRFSVRYGEQNIWPVLDIDDGLEIFCDDLLSGLATRWAYLLLRESCPIVLPSPPDRPRDLAALLERKWEYDLQETADAEEAKFLAFEQTQNIAHWFGGQYDLPPLWVIREGAEMLFDTGSGPVRRTSFVQARAELERVGDQLATHLAAQNDEGKWSRLLAQWHGRETPCDRIRLWSIRLGCPPATTQILADETILPANDPANDNVTGIAEAAGIVPVAARLSGTLETQEILIILKRLRSLAGRGDPAAALADLRDKLCDWRDAAGIDSEKPHEQGTRIAQWLRTALAIPAAGRVDLTGLFSAFGITCSVEDLPIPDLEGLSWWSGADGGAGGPGILLNRGSRRAANLPAHLPFTDSGLARATAAHELAHLLLDMTQLPAVVDLLDGDRLPRRLESRANAFAAAFLLPTACAAKIWEQHDKPVNDLPALDSLIEDLCGQYGVSRSLVTFKLEHGVLPRLNDHEQRRLGKNLDWLRHNRPTSPPIGNPS